MGIRFGNLCVAASLRLAIGSVWDLWPFNLSIAFLV
jgi:hypothetical protein